MVILASGFYYKFCDLVSVELLLALLYSKLLPHLFLQGSIFSLRHFGIELMKQLLVSPCLGFTLLWQSASCADFPTVLIQMNNRNINSNNNSNGKNQYNNKFFFPVLGIYVTTVVFLFSIRKTLLVFRCFYGLAKWQHFLATADG